MLKLTVTPSIGNESTAELTTPLIAINFCLGSVESRPQATGAVSTIATMRSLRMFFIEHPHAKWLQDVPLGVVWVFRRAYARSGI